MATRSIFSDVCREELEALVGCQWLRSADTRDAPIYPVHLGHPRLKPDGAVLVFLEVLQLERSDKA